MNYIVIRTSDDHLEHHGILGMRWGVWNDETRARYTGEGKMRTDIESDSSVTKRVKNDWNTLSNKEFKNRYATSRRTYKKRVNKYGDPYMNSPLAKAGKKLSARKERNLANIEKYKAPAKAIINSIIAAYGVYKIANIYKKTHAGDIYKMGKVINNYKKNTSSFDIMSDLSNYTMDDLKKLDLY